MQQPRWLEIAWAELGQREIAGTRDNARILAYYKDAGHPEVQHDETAWCAAFVGACLTRAGVRGTGSLMARSYLDWGEALAAPEIGAVAVLPRGSDPSAGHVGFVAGVGETAVHLLGGNQGDAVSIASFPRAQVLGFRVPAAAVQPATPTDGAAVPNRPGADFETALAHVLEMEGGWTDDPYDPGGPTNLGITLAVYAAHRGVRLEAGNAGALKAELKAIPRDVVRQIYLQRYWSPCRAEELPAGLALMHFDAAVNHGVGTADRVLQEAVGVEVDGEIGPLTLAAVRAADTGTALQRYADIRRARYRALPHFWRFGRGWLARVDKTLALAIRLTAAATAPTSVPTSSTSPTANNAKDDQTMADQATTSATTSAQTPAATKWWGESMTIWGAALTALSTVLPVLGPIVGFDITGEMVRQLGDQAVHAAQAIGGLIGTAMTIWGRARATTAIERRDISVRL